MNSHNSNADI